MKKTERKGIIFSTSYAVGSKMMNLVVYDKKERPRSKITLNEEQLISLSERIKRCLGTN